MSNYGYTGWQNRSGYKDKIRERDNHTCQICGKAGHDVDHIIPWSISHDNRESNLRVLCHSCNCLTRRQRKDANLPLDEWAEAIKAELAGLPPNLDAPQSKSTGIKEPPNTNIPPVIQWYTTTPDHYGIDEESE